MIAPKFEQFSNDYPNAKYLKVDVDELSGIAQEYGVMAMPTFMIFKDGDKVAEVVGARAQELEASIKAVYVK